jgi:hypothetical protein
MLVVNFIPWPKDVSDGPLNTAAEASPKRHKGICSIEDQTVCSAFIVIWCKNNENAKRKVERKKGTTESRDYYLLQTRIYIGAS